MNVYAAGEIMAGNVLRKGCVAGIGMTIGTVFGRIAGESAARHAKRSQLTREGARVLTRLQRLPLLRGVLSRFSAMEKRRSFLPGVTCDISRICATAAANVCTRASMRRRTSSRSTCHERSRMLGVVRHMRGPPY